MAVRKNSTVVDPYKALNLPHNASSMEIKKSYRDLARRFHPDRLMSASEEEKEQATKHFSRISAAYSLLMDPQRKAQYDHIYKYGGYDDDDDDEAENQEPVRSPDQHHGVSPTTDKESSASRKRKQVGIGYQCTDPFTYLWTSGKIHSTTNMAGISIPSRFQMSTPGAGLSLSYSKGECRFAKDGTRQFLSRTTQFAQGKKQTRTETTTIHKDGRKEVVIEGDNFVERRTTLVQPMSDDSLPWYMSAWAVVNDSLAKCYRPCSAVKQN
jgi:curved DNA-binding protein CbpA